MTDRAQFEAMLEALINEDHDAAKEIFHNIVVGKSREIYEELLAEDFSPEQANAAIGGHSKNEGMEEEEEESMEEDMEEDGAEEEEEEESDGEDGDMDGEEDGEDDGEEDEFGGEEEGGEDMEDRVMDLEDALEDLKAEFEMLLKGEEHEEENEPGIHGDGMPMHDIEAGMEDETMPMMEYYKKVSVTHGDNGQNTKSTVDNMPNDMGGSAKNIAQSFSTEKGGTQGGLAAPTTKPLIGDVMNRPTSDAGKKSFKKQEPGHGAEKKGKGEVGGVDKKSTIGGRIR